jgi:hypothetical protein
MYLAYLPPGGKVANKGRNGRTAAIDRSASFGS